MFVSDREASVETGPEGNQKFSSLAKYSGKGEIFEGKKQKKNRLQNYKFLSTRRSTMISINGQKAPRTTTAKNNRFSAETGTLAASHVPVNGPPHFGALI